ncbi:MAG: hypothetical protein OXB99_07430 [Acidimicrobiaceae bacterium]|nr:hypothetical protein [Acidimicrobiaceae bacterium]
MSTSVEPTAAMSSPAEPHDSAVAEPDAAPQRRRGVGRGRERPGALTAALVTVLGALLVWQLSAMNQNINEMRTELRSEFRSELGVTNQNINELRTELRSEFRSGLSGLRTELSARIDRLESELRAEMQTGFRDVNVILLDHTERLARLETAAGLPD